MDTLVSVGGPMADWLQVKIWIDAEKVVDERLFGWNVTGLGEQHTQLVAAAAQTGHKWLVEVTDPDAPPGEGNIRFGSDSDGMVMPIKMVDDGKINEQFFAAQQRFWGDR